MLPSNGKGEKRPGNSYHMTVEELGILLHHIKGHNSRKYYILVLLQFVMGLRASEVCSIHLFDFSDSFTRLTYRAAKTNEVRSKEPVPDAVAAQLREYVKLNAHTMTDGWFFPNQQNPKKGHITPAEYDAMMAKWRRAIGKSHPQFLDCYVFPSLKSVAIKRILAGVQDIEQLRRQTGADSRDLDAAILSMRKRGLIVSDTLLATEEGLKFAKEEDLICRYRISTHSLRRLHRTVLAKKLNDLALVKNLCGYRDMDTFMRYVAQDKMLEDKPLLLNNTLGPIVQAALTPSLERQSRLLHF